MQVKIAPSILSANFAQLDRELDKIKTADLVHVDVMDGQFVPNITIGAPVVKCLKQYTSLPLDVHLMISEPLKYAEDFAKAGADIIVFHAEAVDDLQQAVDFVKGLGTKVGVAVKPKTPIDVVFPVLEKLDMVLVMTVEPGFGGQSFMQDMLDKVREVRSKWDGDIQVDGGINPETAKLAAEAGANVLVAGSAVYKATVPSDAIEAIRKSTQEL